MTYVIALRVEHFRANGPHAYGDQHICLNGPRPKGIGSWCLNRHRVVENSSGLPCLCVCVCARWGCSMAPAATSVSSVLVTALRVEHFSSNGSHAYDDKMMVILETTENVWECVFELPPCCAELVRAISCVGVCTLGALARELGQACSWSTTRYRGYDDH